MVAVKLALVSLGCATIALVTAPPTRADASIDATPWPPGIVRVAALGRTYAASDIVWLKTVQLLGSNEQAAKEWPQLERWIELVTELDPSFEEPYFLGAILLVTDPRRSPDVDRLLERGQNAFPKLYHLPMLRGFVAQFGSLDPRAAAAHYERASRLPNAPAHLAALAKRLAKETNDCQSVIADLALFGGGSSREQRETLATQRGAILEHCLKRRIDDAATQLFLDNGRHATIEEVEKVLGPLPHPPDRCWTIAAARSSLVPCPAGTPGLPAPAPPGTP